MGWEQAFWVTNERSGVGGLVMVLNLAVIAPLDM